MLISVRNRDILRQAYPTSCWLSAAHFVLQYLGVDVSLTTLHARFYNAVDVRAKQYDEFVNGFSYRYHSRMRTNIFTYCAQIIYLRPLNEMSLFG